jgi:hypothetical protein
MLRERRTLISTVVISTIVMSVLSSGMGKIGSEVRTMAREEVPVVIVGLWPLDGAGALHFVFVQ